MSELDESEFESEDFGTDELAVDIEKPFDPKKVDVSISTPNLSALIARLKHDEIDLLPDFQRSGDLWPKQMQSRLIESILIRLPIPAFYFDAISEEQWQVVDGLQRLTAIKNFVLEESLALTGLEFLADLEGAKYSDLPRTLKRRIDEFQTSVYLIRPGTPIEMKYSLFHRINTGGLKLTPQEIRHAMSQSVNSGLASKFLSKITSNFLFTKVVGKNNKRMTHQELVLRHMAFSMFGTEAYKSSLPKFLDTAMIALSYLNEHDLRGYEQRFLVSMELADTIFGEDAFRKTLVNTQKKLINKPLFEALSVSLAKLNVDDKEILLMNKDEFLGEFSELLSSETFNETISKSTANTVNVNSRFSDIREMISKFIWEYSR